MFKELVTAGVLIGVLVAVFVIVPLLGDQVENSVSFTAGSNWDPSTNTNMTSGITLWESGSGLIKLVLIIGLLTMVIGGLLYMARARTE